MKELYRFNIDGSGETSIVSNTFLSTNPSCPIIKYEIYETKYKKTTYSKFKVSSEDEELRINIINALSEQEDFYTFFVKITYQGEC